MTLTITDCHAVDVRFPTSRDLDGSDAMHHDPDYSAAYVELETDGDLRGHGLAFTLGRGTEICVKSVEALAPLIVGKSLEELTSDMAGCWRNLTSESQLRWIGPEKGAVHLGTAAVVNALWDLWAKQEEKPLWRLVADMSPEELVSCIDFRYLTDVLPPGRALELLKAQADSKDARIAEMEANGYPTYTTSAGWLGYDDDRLRELCRDSIARGWTNFKIKVGRDVEDDIRRCRIIREEIGWDRRLMMDANQVWDVPQAIEHIQALAEFQPWFVEEPTSPDDVLGYAAIAEAVDPIRIAGGEACSNRVMFKQFLQSGGMKVCQLDSCRLGGVNEVLAVMLLAAHFGVPVCPHAGGVGLCEHVQHLAIIDYICVSGTLENRLAEYTDHLHEFFVHPIRMTDGRYQPPTAAGYGVTMTETALSQYAYPNGSEWS